MHKRLRHQVQSLAPSHLDHPELQRLLEAISLCYQQADADRDFLERLSRFFAPHAQQSKTQISPEGMLQRLFSLLETTLNASGEALLLVDRELRPLLGNRSFLEMFDFREKDALTDAGASWFKHLQKMSVKNETVGNGLDAGILYMKDGRVIHYGVHPAHTREGVSGATWIFRDATNDQYAERAALQCVFQDELTGLSDRHHLRSHLERILSEDARKPAPFALLMLDLDGFKYVNDSLGLEQGDAVLVQMGRRLQDLLPEDAILARYGADEFIALIYDAVDRNQVNLIAENLRACVEHPVWVDGTELHLTASIGVAVYPDDGADADILIRNADMALHHAKARGRNNHQFFAEELAVLTAHRLHIRNHLKQALADNEFHLLYQPKVDLASDRIIGVEALIRWQRPDGEIISPAHFIPAAEENGLIIPISEWVLDTVCRQLAQWEQIIDPEFSVAVNISAVHIQRGNLLQSLERVMTQHGTPRGQLELEITEGVFMQDLAKTTELLRAVRERGLRTAVDDFGTGYSSLNYLKALPVDILKIDKSFIDDLAYSARGMNLVRTIIQLAHDLDMQVVAEGIESESIARFLASHGCDVAQGYFFSKPVSPERLTQLLQSGSSGG